MAERSEKRKSRASSHFTANPGERGSGSGENIFSDDFALEPLDINNDSSPLSPEPSGPSLTSTVYIPSHPPSAFAQPLPRRSRSVVENAAVADQSLRTERPVSLSRNDLVESSVSDIPNKPPMSQRPLSSVSSLHTPQVQGPYQGATGPSQPYGMYIQDIGIARSPSSAAASTISPLGRSYAGPNGPTQPYGMYPQGIASEDEISPIENHNRLAPGFPDTSQNYPRRLGTDGEGPADIMGPDGYTEQLPPYTRYVNDIPPKSSLAGPNNAESRGGDQPADSQATLDSPRSEESAMTSLVIDDSTTHINPPSTESRAQPEGGHFKERVKEKGKKRVCFGRIPMWIIMMFILIVAVLLGAVIGGVLSSGGNDHQNNNPKSLNASRPYYNTVYSVATVTATLVDAVPISTSISNLPPLPTGSFVVSLKNNVTMKQDCLSDQIPKETWNCTQGAFMDLTIKGDNSSMEVSLSYHKPEISSSLIRFGAQPPELDGSVALSLMNDKDDWGRGPAYVFSQSFNKLVVLKENAFDSYSKRSIGGETTPDDSLALLKQYASPLGSDAFAQVNEIFWYCFWNGTVLEGFIFVTQNSSTTASPSITSISSHLRPTSTSSATFDLSSNAVLSNVSNVAQLLLNDNGGFSNPSYPKTIKIEERRNDGNLVAPYCQKMQLSTDYTAGPVVGSDGSFTVIPIDENEIQSDMGNQKHRRRSWFGRFPAFAKRSNSWDSACMCEWLIKG